MELIDIAKQLISKEKRIQLIYAFNGTGKTRLSREFIKLFPAECLSNDDITKKTENNFQNCFNLRVKPFDENVFHPPLS